MEHKLERKYGLFTAICMVVGIVIGSGVFFKAQTILEKTNGNMPLGILAWGIGGAIMMVCIFAFANMATKYEKVNGIVDYAEATVGSKYAYYIGWFMTTIYYPTMTSVLAWLCARYTLTFLVSVNPDFPLSIPATEGGCLFSPECLALMLFYMCASYTINALSPKLAGKLQTTTTVIKFIPLCLMAVVGTIYGLIFGMTGQNFTNMATVSPDAVSSQPLFTAVCATAFAYEGWIIATAINAELKDAKRNLPKALVLGGLVVVITYIAYYIGVAGGATNQELIDYGATIAFTNIFGNVLGNILNLFVVVSCIGTMNGLMLGCCRGMYSLAARNQGPKPNVFRQIDSATNMPNNASVVGLFFCAFWGLYFFLSQLSASPSSWLGPFVFDSSEIPIVTTYLLYIPIFLMWMKKSKDVGIVKRFIVPALAIIGSAFMVCACIVGHGIANLYFLIVFVVFMVIGRVIANRPLT